ncbi:hypothetical protein PIB30_113034, partial [Stylosanthes scabra]|nr:hypothetical protein [Stylosanthes scabra]
VNSCTQLRDANFKPPKLCVTYLEELHKKVQGQGIQELGLEMFQSNHCATISYKDGGAEACELCCMGAHDAVPTR